MSNLIFIFFSEEAETKMLTVSPPPNYGYDKVKSFLFNSIKKICQNLDYDSFDKSLPDIKSVLKYGCKDQTSIETLYSVFISEFIPDDFKYTHSMVKESLMCKCPHWINVNKFLVYVCL